MKNLIALSTILLSLSTYAKTNIEAYYNHTEKCGVIYAANTAFYELYQLGANGESKKYSGLTGWPEQNYSSRDLKRIKQVPVSHFYGGSPLGDSFLIVVKRKNSELYNYNQYDEAFSRSLFPKEQTLCQDMEKLNNEETIELVKTYNI